MDFFQIVLLKGIKERFNTIFNDKSQDTLLNSNPRFFDCLGNTNGSGRRNDRDYKRKEIFNK